MALILNIETSSPVCSVCISRDGNQLIEKHESAGTNHASILALFIREIFEQANLKLHDLDAVAVSAGPGSYTGLRIGVVTAKGICFSMDKPLIAIDSLQGLSVGLQSKYPGSDFLYCPTIDARRDEIYFGVFGNQNEIISPSQNLILSGIIPFDLPPLKKLVVGGSGSSKCAAHWRNADFIFDDSINYSAANLISLSEKKCNAAQFENIITFEPHYIKPVYITPGKAVN